MTTDDNSKKIHELELADRKILKASGVTDTERFEDNIAVFYTESGLITVKGSRLKVSGLDLAKGELTLGGEIDSIVYGDRDRKHKTGIGGKIFR